MLNQIKHLSQRIRFNLRISWTTKRHYRVYQELSYDELSEGFLNNWLTPDDEDEKVRKNLKKNLYLSTLKTYSVNTTENVSDQFR